MLRPKYHFTPEKGWMNDPNGLVFFRGEFHLFYQHDPESLVWDTMHWGHAKSKDLRTWEHLPIALYPDEQGVIYSGSAWVDHDNITGWGTPDEPSLLLFYTSHTMDTKREMQCLAYTTDGEHFHKYEKNPIIPGQDHTPARDPQVFRNNILGGFSLCLTREKCVEFYHSTDFVSWEKTGEFTLPEYALHGMIECPCMFDAGSVSSDPSSDASHKFVLMLSMDVPDTEFPKFPKNGDGSFTAIPHSRVMQYFVGTFDGQSFSVDENQQEVLLVDYGPDFYAGTIFANVEDTILMAWLGDFSEAPRNTPTEKEGFRGIQCYPRKLTLVHTEKGYRLHHEFFPPLTKESDDGDISNHSVVPAMHYEKTEAGERFIDGCVSETISTDGRIAKTQYTTGVFT